MYCPFLIIAFRTYQGMSCFKEECAIYDEEAGMCSIKVISQVLNFELGKALKRLSE